MNTFGTQHILERDGCPIHYWLTGPEHGPVVAFSHTGFVDHTMFETQVALLAPYYRLLTWDMRGHGLSQPLRGKLSYRDAAEDLVAILDRLECPQVALVGHSMGGYITQELAFLYPERVVALVSIGSTCITLKQPAMIRLGTRFTLALLRVIPHAVTRWFVPLIAGISPRTMAYVREVCRHVPRRDLIPIWKAITGCYHYETGYRITHPLLLTHGRYDLLLVPRMFAPAWAARDCDGHYVEIPRAGHNAHQDNPQFFNDVLLDFLNEHVL